MIKRVYVGLMLFLFTFYGEQAKSGPAYPSSADQLLRIISLSQQSDSVITAHLLLAKIYLQKGELDAAKQHLQEAKTSNVPVFSKEISALQYSVQGLLHFEEGEYQQALNNYLYSLKLYQQLPQNQQRWEVLEVKNNIGRTLITINELDKAKKHYAEILTALKSLQPSLIDSLQLSNIYNNLGVIHFYEGELDLAYDDYDMSRTIATMSGHPNSVQVARAYYNMGLVREEKGYLVDAGIFYRKALKLYIQNYGQYHHHIAEVYGSLGNIHLTRYELQKARYYFQKDLNTSQHLYGTDHVETTWGYENLGRAYQAEEKDSLAKVMFEKALKIREEAFHGKHIHVANLLLSLAELEPDAALSIQQAKKALAIENAITPNSTIGKWNIFLHLIEKNIELKRYSEAEKQLIKAIHTGKIIADNNRHPMLVRTYLLGAELNLRQKKWILSKSFIQRAFEASLYPKITWKPGEKIKTEWIHFLPEYLDVVQKQAEIVYQESQNGNTAELVKSAESLQSAIELIQIHQKRRTSDDISKQFSSIYKKLYETGIKTSVSLWHSTHQKIYLQQAFEFAERIKNNQSLELLHGMDAYRMSNLPETTLRKEYQLKKDILYYQSILSDGNTAQQQKAGQRLYQLFKEEENFYKNLKKIHPEYYRAKYNFKPFSIEEIQKKITSPGELLWHSTKIDGQEYLFMITDKTAQVLLPEHQRYAEYIKSMCRDKIQKVIVIPDFSSKWVNLEAIRVNQKYLIERMSFIYNASAFNYFNTTNSSKLINKKILAFAPVDFGETKMPPLKYSEAEIRGIRDFFSVKSYFGKDATKKHFHKDLLSYGGLHISSHISYNPVNPLKSKLYLSPEDSSDNGVLFAHDIFGTPMRTHLVTLSACESKKDLQENIGIAGIADAFSYNGCRNILMSLWEVEDKVIKEITVGFYKYLAQGYPKEQALQKSKTDYIAQADKYKSQPFYWSGIILQGDQEALALAPSFWSKNWWLIALGLILFVFLYNRNRST